jgi:TP901 family phage tail tape measure protein
MGTSAEIGIRIFLDDSASAGLYGLNALLNQLGYAALAASAAFGGMSGALAGVGVVLGLAGAFVLFSDAIKFSVQAASDLQAAMYQIAVATHVPMSVAMQYVGTLMNLGSTSTFTSAQIAQGIAQLGRAGYSISQIFDTMAQSGAGFVDEGGKMVPVMSSMAQAGIALAEATGSSAVDGFRMLAQVMAAYQMQADQALMTANLLQFGFEHQRSSVSDFASGLSHVTPIAATFGVSLQDVIAALDTVGPAMNSTAQAGTALYYLIARLYAPTAAGQKEMIALGLATETAGGQFKSVFYDAQGHLVDFTTALQILAQKILSLPPAQQIQALTTIFSVRGGQGADIMIQQLQKYLGYLHQLQATQNNANGVMSRWQQIMNTIGGASAGLSTSITDLAATVGMQLAPYIVMALQGLNNFISTIRNLALTTPQAASTFLLFGAALSGVGFIVGIVLLAVAGIGTTFLLMGAIILGTIAGVVGLSLALTALYIHLGGVNGILARLHAILPIVQTALAAIGVVGAIAIGVWLAPMFLTGLQVVVILAALGVGYAALGVVMAAQGVIWVITNARMLLSALIMRVQLIPSLLASAAAWLLSNAAMLLSVGLYILLAAVIAGAIIGLVLLIQHLGGLTFLLNAAKAIWAQLLPVIEQVGNQIRSAFLQAIQQLLPVWHQLQAAFQMARPVLLVLGAALGGLLVGALGVLIGVIMGVIKAFGALLAGVIHIVAGVIQAFMGLIQFFLGLFTLIYAIFTGNTHLMSQAWSQMGQGIVNIAKGLWAAVSGIFITAFDVIKGLVTGFISGIVGFFHGLSMALVGHSIIPDMLNAILNVFRSILAAIASFIVGWVSTAISIFVHLGSMLVEAITIAINLVRAVFSAGFAAVISFFSGAASAIMGTAARIVSILISAAQSAMAGFRNGFWSGIGNVLSLIGSVPGQILGALAGLGGMLFNSGINAMEMFASGLRSALGSVVSAVANAAGQVANFLGHFSPAKVGPLAHDDQWMPNMMRMMAQGIDDNAPLLSNALQRATAGMAAVPQMSRTAGMSSLAAATLAASSTVHSTQTINLTVDGKTLSQVVLSNVNGQMQMNGLGRAFR